KRLDRFGRKRRATEICMNCNPSSVDDRLQPAGAKELKRSMDVFDHGFKFWDLAVTPYFRQLPPDQIDNQWTRQIICAQRIEMFVDGGNLPTRARFYPVMHINAARRRRATIFPMTAAQGVRLCRKIRTTFSSFASGTHRSSPPLVCASVKRIRRESSVLLQSTATVVATRFSRLPPGTEPCSIKSAISSLIMGTALGSTSAETPLARQSEIKWPIKPYPVTSAAARTSRSSASSAPTVFTLDISAMTFFSSERDATPRLIAVVAMPVPSGLVNTRRSPARAFAFVVRRRTSITPVTASP